ncbi:CvpA family protein [Methanococcoides sp. SA1]|uniref:CvpA family protein n=1 Tax=Candidatus Desulfatifera sulfidica TaxID=2841691 RepID=A0A8J6N805_9BACT|nr:CvpA family protein [Candidatus Desulfatifera sulfidica]NPE29457.1 CvpA family protein [Methanococcoides sp. SA1]
MDLQFTPYDYVILAFFIFFIIRGGWVGFVRQISVILGLYVGYLVAGQYHDKLFPFLKGLSENPQVVFLASYAILFVCTYVLAMLMGKALAKVMDVAIAGWFDKLLGAIFGAAKALIVVVLLHMLLSTFLSPESRLVRDCQLCPLLSQGAVQFQQVIKDERVREAFRQKEPAISSDVPRPEPSSALGDDEETAVQ